MLELKPKLATLGWGLLRALVSLLVAWGVLWGMNLVRLPDVGNSISFPHRLQVDALMEGHLALSTNLAMIDFDLTYSNGGVQQVWGIGVPLWRMIFEIPARFFFDQTAPDRLALWCALALVIYFVYGALKKELFPTIAGEKASWIQRGIRMEMLLLAVLMLASGPFLINILRTRMLVYEETLVYLYLFAMLEFALLLYLRHAEGPRERKGLFLLLSFLAGAGALVRPTLLFYGIASVAVALWWGLGQAKFSRRWALLGAVVFVLPLLLLAQVNWVRFGAPWEFGHALNIQDLQESLYMTHFEATITQAPWWERLREIAGALFFVDQFNACSYLLPHFFPGQSAVPRWREFNYTTFDPVSGALLGIFLVTVLGSALLLKRAPGAWPVRCFGPSIYPVAAWVGLSALGLVGFYCFAPVLTARYMYDFAPLMTVGVTFGLWGLCKKTPLFMILCLLLCGYSLNRFETGMFAPGIASSTQVRNLLQEWKVRDHPVELPRKYKVGQGAIPDIPLACMGWNPQSGECQLISSFYLPWPQKLTLCLEGASEVLDAYPPESIRVTSGCSVMWRLCNVSKTETTQTLTFEAPRWLYQQGQGHPVVLFIALGTLEQWQNKEARPRLASIQGD